MPVSISVLVYLLLLAMTMALIAPSYRSLLVLTGKKSADSFPRSGHEGPGWYLRAMDAHANAIENLPLYIAVLAAAYISQQLGVLDGVAYYYLLARLGQSLVHLAGVNHYLVLLRFTFWLIQLGLLGYVAVQLLLV